MGYKNAEGYPDPTACTAMNHVLRDNHKRLHREPLSRPKIYVVSRYAGNVERNTAAAIRCCQYVIRNGGMPVASHLLYPQMLNDSNPSERELGLAFGLELLALCDEIWIFSDETGLSTGMRAEEAEAKRRKKPIRYYRLEVTS